jgi:hypothetical protein
MFFVLKFELILIIGSNNVLTEGARKVYRGRRVGQGWYRPYIPCNSDDELKLLSGLRKYEESLVSVYRVHHVNTNFTK